MRNRTDSVSVHVSHQSVKGTERYPESGGVLCTTGK
jgi:hypothetical protein